MGSLYKRGKLYWYAYYLGGKLRRKSLKTKDRETAKYLANKINQEIAENKYITYEPNPSSEKSLNEYYAASEHHKVAKSNKDDFSRIKSFLDYEGTKSLNQISEKKLQDYLNYRINTDKVTLNTANRIIASIKAWLNFIVRRKIIADNPIKDFKKFRSPQNPPKFLTKEEIKKILVAAKDNPLYPAIITALYTGIRKKELITLEWPDIDFIQNTITISNKEGFITKSKKYRIIPLHHKLKKFLLKSKQPLGRCFNMANSKRIFPKLIKKAGLKNIGWHHFRHVFASYLCLNGADLYTVAQLLGHSNITITQIYAHLTKDHFKTAVDKLSF